MKKNCNFLLEKEGAKERKGKRDCALENERANNILIHDLPQYIL